MKKEINGKNSKKDTIWTIIGIATILCFFWGLWNYSIATPQMTRSDIIESTAYQNSKSICENIYTNCSDSCWEKDTNIEKDICKQSCGLELNGCLVESLDNLTMAVENMGYEISGQYDNSTIKED